MFFFCISQSLCQVYNLRNPLTCPMLLESQAHSGARRDSKSHGVQKVWKPKTKNCAGFGWENMPKACVDFQEVEQSALLCHAKMKETYIIMCGQPIDCSSALCLLFWWNMTCFYEDNTWFLLGAGIFQGSQSISRCNELRHHHRYHMVNQFTSPGIQSPSDNGNGTYIDKYCAEEVIGHPLSVFGNMTGCLWGLQQSHESEILVGGFK